MNRDQKLAVIDSLKDAFGATQASFVVSYKGMTVAQLQKLRKELRAKQGTLKVSKGRLIKRAVKDLDGLDKLSPYFKDQIGVIFATNQPAEIAKVLHDFAKGTPALRLVAGYFDERVLPEQDIQRLATLPSKEVLLAQVCGTLNAPIAKFVNVLNMQTLRLLWTLQKVAEKKQ